MNFFKTSCMHRFQKFFAPKWTYVEIPFSMNFWSPLLGCEPSGAKQEGRKEEEVCLQQSLQSSFCLVITEYKTARLLRTQAPVNYPWGVLDLSRPGNLSTTLVDHKVSVTAKQAQNENFPSTRCYKQQTIWSSCDFSEMSRSKHEL